MPTFETRTNTTFSFVFTAYSTLSEPHLLCNYCLEIHNAKDIGFPNDQEYIPVGKKYFEKGLPHHRENLLYEEYCNTTHPCIGIMW